MLRFPLAVLVVFIHTFGPTINIEQLHASGLSIENTYYYIRILISGVIARSAVPLFFLFSGFLLFKGIERYDWKSYTTKLRKRWYTLAIPYLLWNTIKIVWGTMLWAVNDLRFGKPLSDVANYFSQNGYLHMLWDCDKWSVSTTWYGAESFASAPILLPFWYMRDLMLMVLLSPVIFWLIKKLRFGFVLLLLTFFLMAMSTPWYSKTITSAALFFSLGAWFSINRKDFTTMLWRWRHTICTVTLLLVISQTITGGNSGDNVSCIVHRFLIIFQTLAFIVCATYLCRFRRLYEFNKRLAPTSFFIYAIHLFFARYITILVMKLTPMNETWYMQTIDYFVTPIVTVALCIALYAAGRKFAPSVIKTLMGERR